MILQIIISNGILDLVTGILAKISLGTGIWAKFRLGTGIWYPPSRPSFNSLQGSYLFGSYFNSKKEFKEVFCRSKNHPRFGVKNNPKKGVILYLKFFLHFWSYNNSLKITVQ